MPVIFINRIELATYKISDAFLYLVKQLSSIAFTIIKKYVIYNITSVTFFF
jgi:hypothetical protein